MPTRFRDDPESIWTIDTRVFLVCCPRFRELARVVCFESLPDDVERGSLKLRPPRSGPG